MIFVLPPSSLGNPLYQSEMVSVIDRLSLRVRQPDTVFLIDFIGSTVTVDHRHVLSSLPSSPPPSSILELFNLSTFFVCLGLGD